MAQAGTAFIEYKGDFSKLHQGAKRATDQTARHFKSSFSGIAKAAAGAFALVGVAGTFSFLKDSIAQARESAKVGKLTAAVLKSTGGAAHVSAKQINDLSTALSNKTGIDDEAIQSNENLLLTFTNVQNQVGKGNDIFTQATKVTLDMSAALGQDGKASAIQLGKALNDPIKGITALSRVGVSFTKQQKDQIKVLVASGDTLGAQKIILKELGKEFGGAAVAAADPWQKFTVVMGNLKERIGTALLPLIGKLADFLSRNLPKALDLASAAINKIKGPVQAVFGWIADHRVAVVAALAGIAAGFVAIKVASGVSAVIGVVTAAMAALASGASGASVALALVGGPVTAIVVGLAALTAGVIYAYTHFKTFHDIVDAVGRFFRDVLWPLIKTVAQGIVTEFAKLTAWTRKHWAEIQEAIVHVINVVRDVIVVFVNVVKALWSAFGSTLIALAKVAWNFIRGIIEGAINIIAGIIRFVLAIINGDWSKAWAALGQIVSGAWTIIKTVVKAGIDETWAIIVLVGKAIRNAWDSIWSGIKDGLGAVWDGIVSAVSKGANAVGDVIAAGINIGIDAINFLIGAINSVTGFLHIPFHISPLGRFSFTHEASSRLGSSGGTGSSASHLAFAAGGSIPGTGSGDIVPAMLEPGEFVMRRAAVQEIGLDTLYRMNRGGQSPDNHHFLLGGLVDAIGHIASSVLGTLRKGAVIAAFAGPNLAFDNLIKTIPNEAIRGILKSTKDAIYNWAKGASTSVDDQIGKAAGAAIGRAIGGTLGPISGGVIARAEAVIKSLESGGNYSIVNPNSGTFGAYQFLPSTWAGLIAQGAGGSIGDKSPAHQDAVAAFHIRRILSQYGGIVEAIPSVWYVGKYDPGHQDYVPSPQAGNTVKVIDYVRMWMQRYAATAPTASAIQGASAGLHHAFRRGGEVLRTAPFTFHAQNADVGVTLEKGWNVVRNDTGAPEPLAPAGRGGPAVQIGQAHFHEGTDFDMVLQKTDFFVRAGRL